MCGLYCGTAAWECLANVLASILFARFAGVSPARVRHRKLKGDENHIEKQSPEILVNILNMDKNR
jgi:hypothetical protein